MRATMWIDAWQQECCGRPFAAGTGVEWPLSGEVDADLLAGLLGQDTARRVRLVLDRHDVTPDATSREATIVSITTVHAQYPSGRARGNRLPHPESVQLRRIDRAGRFEPKTPGAEFVGYLVTLDIRDR